MKDLRPILHFMNMRKVADASDVSYQVLKNYSMGRKEYLSDEDFNKIIKTIQIILGGTK